ncbi:Extracellular ligand-binding receptor [Thermodesulfatator indicus DSM 15286]|uniref:Extracellular ligand-binding receptor n=1 Tax=Thermodesulfatator indicus (strain DSM 15286 / JCM 11887 / CIR29812) TaxID=667014 RepID=F8A8S2_THEID|nr:ABC transporter substrate-binding protein [Thermodesulfatator indicus]AEH44966.1 Extracellular ligand-binding receptor [Thermodesulfatator indicus DSM 15286]
MKKFWCLAVALLGLLLWGTGQAVAEILIGASNAHSGPAKFLGQEYSKGFLAYFRYINQKGGIHGQKIKFIVRDDGYEPDRAITNTKILINDNKVLILAGYVGTPTSKAAVPVAEEHKVPFFFPFTGAEFLRNPVRPLVFNLRASYYMETEEMVHYLADKLGLKRIAIFYQDDSFGWAGLAGFKKAMEKRGLPILGEATYPRNTVAVKRAAYEMKKLKPQAIVMIGAYKPCAVFIKTAKEMGLTRTKFINISFVGSKALARELGPAGDGVLITQVVPFPWDTSIPAVAEYQRIMRQFYSDFEPGFVSLEGFLAAKTLVEILNRASSLTRESILQAAENLRDYDPGVGEKISFSPNDHQGFEKVYLVEIKNGKFKPVNY